MIIEESKLSDSLSEEPMDLESSSNDELDIMLNNLINKDNPDLLNRDKQISKNKQKKASLVKKRNDKFRSIKMGTI